MGLGLGAGVRTGTIGVRPLVVVTGVLWLGVPVAGSHLALLVLVLVLVLPPARAWPDNSALSTAMASAVFMVSS